MWLRIKLCIAYKKIKIPCDYVSATPWRCKGSGGIGPRSFRKTSNNTRRATKKLLQNTKDNTVIANSSIDVTNFHTQQSQKSDHRRSSFLTRSINVATILHLPQYYGYRKQNKNQGTAHEGQCILFIHCQHYFLVRVTPSFSFFLLSLINKTYLLICNNVRHLCNCSFC